MMDVLGFCLTAALILWYTGESSAAVTTLLVGVGWGFAEFVIWVWSREPHEIDGVVRRRREDDGRDSGGKGGAFAGVGSDDELRT